ncbi:MAG: hypothetical protein TREMPRED_005654 [Tremellales sp. Tagirdzhanova-0007]|nr:MAG: hypothetical protein TREMPRED_005654 [Tremellales sp. Tagirdzhanova-0007]
MSTADSHTTANSSRISQQQVRRGTKSPRDAQLAKWGLAPQPSKNYTVKELYKMLSKVKDSIGLLATTPSLAWSTAGETLASNYRDDVDSIGESFLELFSVKEGNDRGTHESGHLKKLAHLRSRIEPFEGIWGMTADEKKIIDRAVCWIAATRETSRALSKE